MCGFVAILHKDGERPVDRTILLEMTGLLKHRGPDDSGTHIDREVGLGHRRLSVIDLGGGHQPMQGPSGATWIVYNGEVFNYRELRAELEGRGVRFRTSSDTEVLLALYEVEGPLFVKRLNGMFSFAIWDEQIRTLVVGRDRVGVKPLYVWNSPKALVVASEIKAILAYPGVPRSLRANSLPEYLAFRHLAGRRTMFDGIDSMEPGTVQVHRGERVKSISYWTAPDGNAKSARIGTKEAAEQLRDLLTDSIRLRLVADVPLGTFNSGGLDSSIVTAITTKLVSQPVRTFSVGFNEPSFDERKYARQVARDFSTIHEEVVGDAISFAEELPQCIWYHDEPLNHANSVLIQQLSRVAKKKVTVVLTGEGSDELFAGYPRYRLPRVLAGLRRLGSWPEGLLGAVLGADGSRKQKLIRAALGMEDEWLIASNARFLLDEDLRELCVGDTMADRLRDVSGGSDLLSRTLAFDRVNYLHNVLQRMDKMTMAAGLEARVPFLDYRIIEFAATLGPSTKMPMLRTKAVVKKAGAGLISEQIIRRAKSGFGVPLADWMRRENSLGRYLDMLCEKRTLERGWWDRSTTVHFVQKHRGGEDHSDVLWSLINCELWARIMLDTSHLSSGEKELGTSVAFSKELSVM